MSPHSLRLQFSQLETSQNTFWIKNVRASLLLKTTAPFNGNDNTSATVGAELICAVKNTC